jgi:hypothetical protein
MKMAIESTTPFPEYSEWLEYIAIEDARAALRYLAEAARHLSGYEARPVRHGYMRRNYHYYKDGTLLFAFAVNKQWLLFYLCKLRQTHPKLSVNDLRKLFSDVNVLKDGKVTFKIQSEAEARSVVAVVFGETCAICGCLLHRDGDYASPSTHGRSHATKHHYVAERFFGRSKNRKGEVRKGIFTVCPWSHEKKEVVLCYECHEELIHNPVFLSEDIERLAALVKRRGFSEEQKPDDRSKIAGRIRLLREVIDAGLTSVANRDERSI